ncbi:hypothetical protein CC86DRAFT_401206 [Ophiobolus disseminans]|uniref:SGNH hydrolase n=1 Tax=Ophiobolus disseminans TaxID=1469910 RepID=A0A6A7AGL3_9PLEO|nr:hypothetical protein CC86DRAFT_401206 [Ophiobolus disseminans]
MAPPGIDFQNLPCSGAVVGEVLRGGEKSQIDSWQNPQKADIATISIGGNDIGFYNILTACVLRVGQGFAGDCDVALSKANEMIQGRDLRNDVASALQQIMEKSGRTGFKIYVTGYPAFFNVDTLYCDYTTFYYWEPGHHFFHHPGDWAYLLQERRRKLNNVVMALNRMLLEVVDGVNRNGWTQRAIFVDPNPQYNGHRFCEKDAGRDVREPDEKREDTWLFLSGWPDNSLPGTASAARAIEQERKAISMGPNKTAGNLDGYGLVGACMDSETHDWAQLIACDVAVATIVTSSNNSAPNLAKSIYRKDLAAIAKGDFEAVQVPWYVPTRSAKTFHPKTLGQLAYKTAIMNVW